jgi:hypothetical protein
MSSTYDVKRELACYRARRDTPELVEVPELRYLMIDGQGDPNSEAFAAAVRALYPVAYRVKFASRRELGRDHVVPPLEALWWADDMSSFTTARDKARWHWTALIMTPQWIPAELVDEAAGRLLAGDPPDRLGDVRLGTLSEGTCVQALHVGPFDAEGPLLARIHGEFVPDHHLRMVGRHHEVYLSDPRRTAPERLRTLLRQPVRPLDGPG